MGNPRCPVTRYRGSKGSNLLKPFTCGGELDHLGSVRDPETGRLMNHFRCLRCGKESWIEDPEKKE